MEKKPKIKLYVVCHKEAAVADSELLCPIQVGAELNENRFAGMLPDNTGDNISSKNKQYAELTAQYWAWKNEDVDYYGLFHYRRYFSFNPIEAQKEVWIDEKGLSVFDKMYESISEKALTEMNFSTEIIEKFISQYDVIAPIPDEMDVSVYENYKRSLYHRVEDIDEAIKVITELYPEYIEAMKTYLNSKKAYFCNMFIMKKEFFHEYSEWLFNVLDEVEKRRDYSNYSVAEDRALAFLAERLFGIYYTYCKLEKNIKTTELQRVLFKNTNPEKKIEKIAKKNSIPLVLACDNNYVKYAATVVMSALMNTSVENYLDVIILERQISESNKKLVAKTFEKYQNISVRFVNIQGTFNQDMDMVFPKHYPAEIAYRLRASELLEAYDKFVYVDCDTLVLGDIKQLYDVDLGDNYFGMAKDIDYIGHLCSDSEWRKHSESKLGLKNPMCYYQSGVMVFNARKVRENYSSLDLFKQMVEEDYRFPDQDLLNVVGEGKIYNLGLKWNFLAEFKEGDFSRKKNVISKAPKELYEEYLEAEKAPQIIHFCIPPHLRPWNNPEIDGGIQYWNALKYTFFYEIVLADLVRSRMKNSPCATSATAEQMVQGNPMVQIVDGEGIRIQGIDEVIYIRGVYIKIIQRLNKMFPMGSKKRAFLKKIAKKLFK